jgi:hypothetical protein
MNDMNVSVSSQLLTDQVTDDRLLSFLLNFFYTFAHLKRRFYISQTSKAGLLNITKAIYQWQSNRCQSTFKDARPFGSAFRMCNGVKVYS